ncbi:hypothetical protein DEJ50_18930 [Streptomyces venezuelae]|uniref:Uncharacterized protein n=1 Tax=Streptomyces venezuelae TaxID=54571 RepID=A0A5P2D8U1_STRVZ|nr:hypothetical protein DEJ50_18930 [Streptomyces venezuelae]
MGSRSAGAMGVPPARAKPRAWGRVGTPGRRRAPSAQRPPGPAQVLHAARPARAGVPDAHPCRPAARLPTRPGGASGGGAASGR